MAKYAKSINTRPHLLVDLFRCKRRILDDEALVRSALLDAATASGASVIDSTFHRFRGGGVTGVVAVQESHISIHTWPSEGYAAADIFLCGKADPEEALRVLIERFEPKSVDVRREARGRRLPRLLRAESRRSAENAGNKAPSLFWVYVITAIVATCSLIYELLLAQTLSTLLGDTVLRYSITIGCYLGALGIGAMLCGSDPPNAATRLMKVELALSLIGGVAVPVFFILDVVQRYFFALSDNPLAGSPLVPWLFLLSTHLVIVAIGLLSGFEIPLLLSLGEERRPGSTNRVLGVDYLGALVGSVFFPLILLRQLGVLSTGFVVAAVNAIACVMILILRPQPRPVATTVGAVATFALLVAGFSQSDALQQYFLKKFFYAYYDDKPSLAVALAPNPERPRVQRTRSPYQNADLVQVPSPNQFFYDLLSDKRRRQPDYPLDLYLYLNRSYQLFSGSDEIYHEWFVHVPLQAARLRPRKVLILGGGDGLVLREVLRYDTLEQVTLVELDPMMIELATTEPRLRIMNNNAFADPRVRLVQADAFSWLRGSRETFDAAYVDMPVPRSYGVSKVYSREFYTLVSRHLAPQGFLAMDAPGSDCELEGNLWPVYMNTLRAAGFRDIEQMEARFNLNAPEVRARVRAAAEKEQLARVNARDPRYPPVTLEQAVSGVNRSLQQLLSDERQTFIVAFKQGTALNDTWIDMGIDLHALAPAHLPLAFTRNCDHRSRPELVNSIFRPTLPTLQVATVRMP